MAQPIERNRRRTLSLVGTVYLLHFSQPYHHARHYLGFTFDLQARVATHRRGRGSPLIAAAIGAGVELFVARTWENVTRGFERRGHRRRGNRAVCPICIGARAYRAYCPRRDPQTGIGR